MQCHFTTRFLSLALGSASLVLGSGAGIAQELEQVLVTATRVPQDGLLAPLSWSAVSREELLLVGQTHPNEVMQRVPGAWISRGNGQESLTALRSPVLTGAGGCGSFLMAADSISLRAPGFCNVNQLFDANTEQADRIEVIKGPATALYGASAMHGVINVLSPAPAGEPWQRIALETGPDDYYRGRYQYSGEHGPHGINLRMVGTTDGGYLDDAGYDQQKTSLRHDYRGGDWQLTSVLEGSNLNQETAGFIEGFKAYEDDELRKTNPNPEAYRDAWSVRAYSELALDLDPGRTLRITPYYRNNRMEFLQHFLPWKAIEENGHESLGLRAALHAGGGPVRWVAGTDIEYTRGWLLETQPQPFSPNQPEGVHYDYEVDARAAAAFAQVTADLGERWMLDGGLRLEHTRYNYDNLAGDGSACSPEASNCRFFRPADSTDEFSDWSLNLGATYRWHEQHLVYLRGANGFRAPETAELYRLQAGQQSADLDSERITNFEVGVRGELGASLAYSLALYDMRKEDVIFQDANRQNVSGARTSHRGVELSLDYQWNAAWYAALDMTAARHRYENNPPLLGVDGGIEGNDIDTAPRLFGSARAGWRGERAGAELEWVYMDDYYLEPTNQFSYEGHHLLNLRATTDIGRHLAATVRVSNLLDAEYAERADYGFGSYRYFVGQPRGIYLELAFQP